MSSENMNSELAAKFDEILGKAFRHRGKHRAKYIIELKQLFVDHINVPSRAAKTPVNKDTQKLKTKLQRTEAKLKLTNQSWKITQGFCQKADTKIEKLEKELKKTSATLREKEQTLKTIRLLLKP